MPIVADIEQQNICCEKVLNILRQNKEGIPITYRSMIKTRQWDSYCKITGANYDQAFHDLDSKITIHQDILSQIGYKYQCSELCPLPDCLDNIKCWETDLIRNWAKIEDIVSWLNVGMRQDKIASWFGVPVESVRKWNHKLKKISNREDIYRGFQDYLDYI
jgi:hypothetical protein